MKNYALMLSALLLSAVGAQAATDWTIYLTNISGTQLWYNSGPKANGLTYDRLVLYGAETPTRSKHIIPLNNVNPIVAGAPTFGTLVRVSGSGTSGGGGGGKLHGPVLQTSRQVTQESGVNYIETVTTYADGTIRMDSSPQANGVLAEQGVQQQGVSAGELTLTVREAEGPNKGTFSGYSVWCPRVATGSTIGVTHYSSTNFYMVTSFQISIGGATLSLSGTNMSIAIDWFKQAKGE